LAARPEPRGELKLRYDEGRQISQVWEAGRWVDSWLSRNIPGTKKADHETGEDNKGE